MAGNLATKQEYNVGWGFHLNNKNTVASQNSSGSENLTDQKMVLTPLTTLTTASYEAQTLVLSGFQAHEVCSYIGKPLKADEVRSYTLEYWLMPACHPAACCEQRADRSALTLRLPLKKCRQCLLRHPATSCEQRADQSALTYGKLLKKCSQRLLRHPATGCEQRHEREARELTPKRKRSVFVGGGTVPFIASNPEQPEPTKISALRDLFVKGTKLLRH